TSCDMWIDAQEKILSQKTVKYNGEELPIPKAVSMLPDLPTRKGRMDLHKKIIEVLKSNGKIAEAELNAVYTYKKVMDEVRGFETPYSGTLLSFENDKKTVD